MAEEMKHRIVSELKAGSKTDEELRRALLGERPGEEERKARRDYDSRYQAVRRALQELVGKRVVAEARYSLLEEVADNAYLSELLKRNLKTTDVSRLRYVMEEVQSECGKLGAVRTLGLLEFLEPKLNHKDPKIRELTVSSLRYLVSRLDDAKREEKGILGRVGERFNSSIVDLAKKDESVSVRGEASKLLAELGLPESIDALISVVKNEHKQNFGKLYEPLKEALCHKYDERAFSKNRLIRDYKSAVREALLDLSEAKDAEVGKRAEALLWHFRSGGLSHYPGGEPF